MIQHDNRFNWPWKAKSGVFFKTKIDFLKYINANSKNGVFDGALELRNLNLKKLPDLSNIILDGADYNWFECGENKLKNLIGSPKYVKHHFWCYDNPLESLEGLPEYIGGDFCIDRKTWNNIPDTDSRKIELILKNNVTFIYEC